jgi:hypothetical protein
MLLSGVTPAARAQSGTPGPNPCDIPSNPPAGQTENGLTPVDDGLIVYDANNGVCWLADANLAANASARARLGAAGINLDGTMDYLTALNWVLAMNNFNQGQGFLGHHDWQLPDTAQKDPSCSSVNNGNFGASCTGSALGNLYYVGLARHFPDSVVPRFLSLIPPFRDLQPGLYWTSDANSGGEVTFSFNTGLSGANTTKYNYLHVLPMVQGPIGAPPPGSGIVPYTGDSPAAGKAVYDTITKTTWSLFANLAADYNFGVTGTTTIVPDVPTSVTVTVPLIDQDGAMLLGTAQDNGGWIDGMNKHRYAGSANWMLPHLSDLTALYADLSLPPGDVRLEAQGNTGPFQHLQPGFYWACERDPDPNGNKAPCDPNLSPATNPTYAYSFNFDNGFEGTDLLGKQFYVMVYYPAQK